MKTILFTIAIFITAFSFCHAQNAATGADAPLVFNTVEEMAASKVVATVAIVKDEHRGGTFLYSKEKHKADDGVVFKGADKGYWVRVCNKYQGVDAAWFGAKMDSVSNDADALSRALSYDQVYITGLLKIKGKVTAKEGKTIVFTASGGILLADSCLFSFDAYIKAEDYSNIFRGNGKVVFGTKATPYVSPCWFGAVADYTGGVTNSTDNAPAIQKAIFAAEKVSDVYLPPTAANMFYRIGSCLTISKKLHFYSFKFHGGGTTITGNPSDKATTIFADFTSGPAINIQGSRRTYISDFKLVGRNMAVRKVFGEAWDNKIYCTPSFDTITYFYDKGIARNYAGIATDAEKANNVWSADIQFDRLQIECFYVGLSINDAGNMQGDRMRVNNCQINDCTYGISVGNPQARSCHFENVDMNRVYIGYTNSTFGSGSGSEFEITGGQYCNLYKLFHIQPYNLGQCLVSGLYTESLGSIGEIGYGSTNENSFIFTGCFFMLTDVTAFKKATGYYSKYYTLTAFANVSFIGCNFETYKPYMAFLAANEGVSYHSLINLTGCTFYNTKFFHGWGNINIENSHFAPKEETIDINRTIRVPLNGSRRYNTGYYAASVVPLFDGLSRDSLNPSSAMQVSRTIPVFYAVEDGASGISDLNYKRDTLTFSYSDTLERNLFRYVLPGDVLGTTLKGVQTLWDNPTLNVLAIDHDMRKATVVVNTETFSFDKIALYTNCFFTTQPVSGDTKEGSAEITNTLNENLLREGDFITFKNAVHSYRIRKIDTEKHTIQLMDNIREKDNSGIVLYNEQLYSCNK